MRTINSVAWAKYFGRLHLGSITGATSTILIAGSALGPMPLGIARDLLGDYDLTLTLFAVLPLILSVISLLMSRPVKSDITSSGMKINRFKRIIVSVRNFLSL